jgi:hypothetical protein
MKKRVFCGSSFRHPIVKTDPGYNSEDPLLDIIVKTNPGYNSEDPLLDIIVKTNPGYNSEDPILHLS